MGNNWSPNRKVHVVRVEWLVRTRRRTHEVAARPMVGPNGEVYVLYTAIGPVDADSVKIAKSTDNGATFAPAVVAMTEYNNYFTGAPGFNRPRAVTFAAGAVDRSTGPNRGSIDVRHRRRTVAAVFLPVSVTVCLVNGLKTALRSRF